jgi:hypothetical protein
MRSESNQHAVTATRPSPRRFSVNCWLTLLIAFVSGGATCSKRRTEDLFAPPIVFEAPPTLPEIAEQINRSLALEHLESNTLTISSDEMPTKLRGNMKWERPHNFSLEAYPGTKLMGLALAAGSNSEMFWLQTRVPSPPTLYYARHDDFNSQSGPRKILPVSPLWLREALGVIEMDPALHHDEPIERPDGKLEVRSLIPTPRGPYSRHVVLDARTATIEQTLLYDQIGKLIAHAQQSKHEYYAAIDFSLPHRVDIQLQPDIGPMIAFTVEVGFYLVNESAENEADAFRFPDTRGITTVPLIASDPQVSTGLANPISARPGTPTPPVYAPSYTPAEPYRVPSSLSNYRRAN